MNQDNDTARPVRPMDAEMPWLDSDVYQTLRAIAHAKMRDERAGHLLQTTALINETFLKLSRESEGGTASDSNAIYFQAARAMRYVLIEEARKRNAAKRGGGGQRVALDTGHLIADDGIGLDYLELHEALNRLEKLEARAGQVVELRFFGGMTMPQIATVLGVSLRTVEKDWAFARAWLRNELGE
ncbi:MAG: RNA polymerase subunit sigma [Planctomycetes bacterium]|nr:RNA polymerase subunit sigma [Planctomycetota bacterium]NOG55613.1 RNA polymerase subunit sigma [Planctomycetota bacterium]